MDAQTAADVYRQELDQYGEWIAIRRYAGLGASQTWLDVAVRARVKGFLPEELVGSIQQGDRKLIVLAEDLTGYSPPRVILLSDKAIVRDRELAIIALDDNTRRIGATLIAYELVARG